MALPFSLFTDRPCRSIDHPLRRDNTQHRLLVGVIPSSEANRHFGLLADPEHKVRVYLGREVVRNDDGADGLHSGKY